MPFAATWMQLEIIILSKSERQILYDITYMKNLKYDTNEPILSVKHKQNHGHREQTGGCQGGGEQERDGLEVWGQQMQTGLYRMDKQQGPTAQHRELYSIL